jgi:hypothetical protein
MNIQLNIFEKSKNKVKSGKNKAYQWCVLIKEAKAKEFCLVLKHVVQKNDCYVFTLNNL